MISPFDLGLPPRFKEFRSYNGFSQFRAAVQLASSHKRIRGACAPTGTGKSLLAMATSRLLDSSRTLYLTVNKSLQTQLVQEFGGSGSQTEMFNLVGHSSYPCASRSTLGTGEFGDLECSLSREECPYWRDVQDSLSHSHACTNIANWVSIAAKANDPLRFGDFDFLIIDEAHNLESVLCGLLAVEFSGPTIYTLIGRILPEVSASLSTWVSFCRESIPIAESIYESSRASDKREKSFESLNTKRLRNLISNLYTIASITDEWVVAQDTGQNSVRLTPVFASNYAEKYLFRGIEDVLLMSATITSLDLEYLGAKDHFFIDIDSPFDPARRPFYYWPTTAIDFNSVEGQTRQVVNRIDKVIDSRQALGWKGLIHSVSYDWAGKIARYSRHPIITHTSRNSRQVIDSWMRSDKPSVICSPVLLEGVDLSGDLARYQFFWKVPTLYSQDPLTAARMKRDKRYKNYMAAKKILQGTGRVMRSEKDFGETYILDKHWGNWMSNAVPWPLYFRKSWQTVRDVPEPLTF